jgi:hypothetical protein
MGRSGWVVLEGIATGMPEAFPLGISGSPGPRDQFLNRLAGSKIDRVRKRPGPPSRREAGESTTVTASELYEQFLRLQPGRLDLWKTAGAIYYYELEDRPAALRCFRRALSLEPDPAERAKLEELLRELEG